MEIKVLGSGSAFTLNNYQTSYLIGLGKNKLLFDCGGDIRFALRDQGMGHNDIDHVFISHLHSDHIGGLEWLGFSKYFSGSKASLYISEVLINDLWNRCLSGGMGSLQGFVCDLHTYFNPYPLKVNDSFHLSEAVLQPVQTVHIMNGYYIVPSFGLMITENKKRLFITGDTQFCPHQIMDFYKSADLIIHDCELLYVNGVEIKSGVHAHYEDLRSLPIEIKNKIWLSHYQDNTNGKDPEKDGFLGFLKRGQTITV